MARRYVRREVPAEEGASVLPAWAGWRGPIRLISGLAVVIALALIALNTYVSIANANQQLGQEPSAIQLIQVYAEGCFLSIVAIGIGIGIYVATRADD